MKEIKKVRNVKAQVSLPAKGDRKMDLVIKNPPNLKPKNKRAK